MHRTHSLLIAAGLIGSVGLASCSDKPSQQAASDAAGSGMLTIHANGEDFVRQGFTTKDGWQISFDHVYVNLANVKAYQTDPPFDPQKGEAIKATAEVGTDEAITVDLAEGDTPVQVAVLDAPAGRYNAISWEMVGDPETQQDPLTMVGTATKDGETVNFSISLAEELGFVCGDFVGDERKGFLDSGDSADVEATFHFDHLFGDSETPADAPLNEGALGFEPLAALADDGQLELDSTGLEAQLSDEDFQTLMAILPSLGHVGEGHCEETRL
ncbi:MAG: DUF4382 domain-containing protein [Cyanobacteria bacterium P01_H01_bin.105]